MMVAGVLLGIWAIANLIGADRNTTTVTVPATPTALVTQATVAADASAAVAPEQTAPVAIEPSATPTVTPLPTPTATPVPIDLAIDPGTAPQSAFGNLANGAHANGARLVTDTVAPAIRLSLDPALGEQPYTVTFAVATRFDTIDPAIDYAALRQIWAGDVTTYTQVAVFTDTLPLLQSMLGRAGPAVQGYAVISDVVTAAWQDRTTLAIVPFNQLEPRLVVMAVDGQNPVDNSSGFDPARYPLAAPVYTAVDRRADLAQRILARTVLDALPPGNRNPERLTVVAMTGVTAMCRMTAAEMDRRGSAWPAEVVGPALASADITHISNEVPFVEDCDTNTNPDNLNFCSKYEYMDTLTASGVDIIGLTGNHQNDYGLENALGSLDFYDEAGLPVYGGGRNLDDAHRPLYVEHNGNRLAFLGANSYGPRFAWATDSTPGSAPFDLNIMSAGIRSVKEQGRADVVLAELQYQESYDTEPLYDQRSDFNALVRAGADIVTGVQSHVPQGMEFTDGKLVLYGLGNLFFDQMNSTATREGMIVKHTIYEGRHISTQLLTTLLYDYGQPQWTTPEERTYLLRRVFDASYW
jgi:poly-gamma-glutamate synthesis protein (capsule biosynthesis protein)